MGQTGDSVRRASSIFLFLYSAFICVFLFSFLVTDIISRISSAGEQVIPKEASRQKRSSDLELDM